MTETYHGLEIVEDKTMRIDGEVRDLKKGQKIYVNKGLISHLLRAPFTKKTGQRKEVEGADERIIMSEVETSQSDEDDEKEFDYEEYVDEHNADDVIADVEESDSVTWLENLHNYDDRVTVQDAIQDRLEELEG